MVISVWKWINPAKPLKSEMIRRMLNMPFDRGGLFARVAMKNPRLANSNANSGSGLLNFMEILVKRMG